MGQPGIAVAAPFGLEFMANRLPVIPTIFVGAAIAVMIALGFWQLARMDEKEAMLSRFAQAQTLDEPVAFPRKAEDIDDALYRRSSVTCAEVLSQRTTPGHNEAGRTGIAQMARCRLDGGGEAEVAFGWTATPQVVEWRGGAVQGVVGPAGTEARLVADPAAGGLESLARPDPADIPNNHLAYAGQWFFFALTALVIYILALRRRTHGGGTRARDD